MVGIHYEQIKQKQLELELKALDLIATHGNTYNKTDVVKRLYEIAFPDRLAEEIGTTLEAFEKRTEK